MEEEEKQQEEFGTSTAKRVTKMFGGNFTKERKSELYFGKPPPDFYPTKRDAEHIHDLRFTPEQINKLYGLPPKGQMAAESVESDTKKDLVKELQDKGLTREEARLTIADLIKAGVLIEIYDPDLREKVLVLRS